MGGVIGAAAFGILRSAAADRKGGVVAGGVVAGGGEAGAAAAAMAVRTARA